MKKLGLALPMLMLPGVALAQPGYSSLCEVSLALPTYGSGTFQPITCSGNGALVVQPVGTLAITSGSTLAVSPVASASGGGTGTQILSAASNNATNIKPNPGTLYVAVALNTASTTAYLKFYDTSGIPQCGTTSVKFTLPLVQNVPMAISPAVGISFTSGIGLCITAGQAVTDNASATTGVSLSMVYQ